MERRHSAQLLAVYTRRDTPSIIFTIISSLISLNWHLLGTSLFALRPLIRRFATAVVHDSAVLGLSSQLVSYVSAEDTALRRRFAGSWRELTPWEAPLSLVATSSWAWAPFSPVVQRHAKKSLKRALCPQQVVEHCCLRLVPMHGRVRGDL